MPICTIHLLSLQTNWDQFQHAIDSSTPKPLILAKVIRWIITPTTLSKDSLIPGNNLNEWDALLILPISSPSLAPAITAQTRRRWSIQAGVPSALISNFHSRNSQLLHPPPGGSVPPLSGSLDHDPRVADSAQRLELTTELNHWIKSTNSPAGAVSMLNLLAFRSGQREAYAEYGKAFADSVGSRRGGVAKIVGKAIDAGATGSYDGWDEVALAHYPSLKHFADMLASEDYQQANHRWRVPSLRDTCILCTSEVEIEDGVGKAHL